MNEQQVKPHLHEHEVETEIEKIKNDPQYFIDVYCIILKKQDPNQQKLDFNEGND